MGFQFTKRGVDIEIEGKTYTVNIQDTDTQDALAKVYKVFETYDADTLANNERANYTVSCTLRDMVGALIGLDGQNEIFENRAHCVIDELELINYIYGEVKAHSGDTPTLEELLASLNVGTEGINLPKTDEPSVSEAGGAVKDAIGGVINAAKNNK